MNKTRQALADVLRPMVYVCTRDWNAWSYGTMTQDDFHPAWEDDEILSSLEDVVCDAVHEATDAMRLAEKGKGMPDPGATFLTIWMHPNGGVMRHEPVCKGWLGPFTFQQTVVSLHSSGPAPTQEEISQ